jgi:multisubunit Na+/H+ antiporter MnhB subunit
MKYDAAIVRGASALVLPLMFLFALAVLATHAPGQGSGVLAGLSFALALTLHVLAFGAGASRRAFPGAAARFCLALGVILAVAGAGFVGLFFAMQMTEFGIFLAIIGAAQLILAALIGRAPTLLDEEW